MRLTSRKRQSQYLFWRYHLRCQPVVSSGAGCSLQAFLALLETTASRLTSEDVPRSGLRQRVFLSWRVIKPVCHMWHLDFLCSALKAPSYICSSGRSQVISKFIFLRPLMPLGRFSDTPMSRKSRTIDVGHMGRRVTKFCPTEEFAYSKIYTSLFSLSCLLIRFRLAFLRLWSTFSLRQVQISANSHIPHLNASSMSTPFGIRSPRHQAMIFFR